MNRYVLDACAVIALLQDELGADIVADALNSANEGQAEILMHKANFLEVYYDLYRVLGKDKANEIKDKILERPIKFIDEITDDIFNEAGRLKATYKISFADSFALAQAIISGGELLTSDHHEFNVIEKSENIKIRWIR